MRATQRQAGFVLIWVALLLIVFIGIVGLALETGRLVLTGQQLQVGADAGALAGAQLIRGGLYEAQDAAADTTLLNFAAGAPVQLAYSESQLNTEDGDITFGRYDRDAREFTPALEGVNAVRVVARRTGDAPGGALALLFGPIFGVEEANLSRSAIAMVGGGTGAGLIALNSDARCALHFRGNTTLDVDDGAIQVNSDHSSALCNNGKPTVHAEEINVVGDISGNLSNYEGEINTDASPISDPLEDLLPPPYDTGDPLYIEQSTPDPDVDGGYILSPGYYPEGISMTGSNEHLTLEPGIYVVDGAGLDINGGTLVAEGVMFYVVNDADPASSVYLGGNAEITISGMPFEFDEFEALGLTFDIYDWAGLAIVQSRDNHNDATIIGTSSNEIEGTLYFPENHVDLRGTGDAFKITQLLADTIEVRGDGALNINYDGRFEAAGNKIFLVD